MPTLLATRRRCSRPTTINSRAWRGAEIPGANGHSTARALARIYGAASRGGEVDGVQHLLARGACRAPIPSSPKDSTRCCASPPASASALCSPCPAFSTGPNPHSFGHPGAGGSLGFRRSRCAGRLRLRDESNGPGNLGADRSAMHYADRRGLRLNLIRKKEGAGISSAPPFDQPICRPGSSPLAVGRSDHNALARYDDVERLLIDKVRLILTDRFVFWRQG